MLQHLPTRPSRAFPVSLLPFGIRVPVSRLPLAAPADALALLPPVIGTVSEVRTGAVAVHADETIYAISEPRTNKFLYVGLTTEPLGERLRKHSSKRKASADDVSPFSRTFATAPGRDAWRVAAAPPHAYVAFVMDAVTEVRDRLQKQGALRPSLAARVDALLTHPARWTRFASVVEWLLVAVVGPTANTKGNCYVGANGLVARPVDFLIAFVRISTMTERRHSTALVAA